MCVAEGGDSVRLLDEQTFELLDRLQLQQHELAVSVCRCGACAYCLPPGCHAWPAVWRRRALGSLAHHSPLAALHACCSTRLGDDPATYYVVGTAFAMPDEPEATKVQAGLAAWGRSDILELHDAVAPARQLGSLPSPCGTQCTGKCPQAALPQLIKPSARPKSAGPHLCAGCHRRQVPSGVREGDTRRGEATLPVLLLQGGVDAVHSLGLAAWRHQRHQRLTQRLGACGAAPPCLLLCCLPSVRVQLSRCALCMLQVYALTEFQGRLLAGINSRVQMYK